MRAIISQISDRTLAGCETFTTLNEILLVAGKVRPYSLWHERKDCRRWHWILWVYTHVRLQFTVFRWIRWTCSHFIMSWLQFLRMAIVIIVLTHF